MLLWKLTTANIGSVPPWITCTCQRRGQGWEGMQKKAKPIPSLGLRLQATGNWSSMRLGLCHSSDIIFGDRGPESSIFLLYNMYKLRNNLPLLRLEPNPQEPADLVTWGYQPQLHQLQLCGHIRPFSQHYNQQSLSYYLFYSYLPTVECTASQFW